VSYRHLLGRFRTAWDWGWEEQARWAKYWEQRDARDRMTATVREDLQATRDTLAQTLLGLQVFMGAVQNAEEERLANLCEACRTDDATLREMAETALRDMATARLEAERFQGDSYAKYGTLLRTWLRRQQAALGVLDVAGKPLAEAQAAK
jgi:hypothetical protein